jgi:tetratricopeptide (TPR) repeat protein
VYEAVVPLNIDGAIDKAFETLAFAGLLNPTSPEVDYHVASLKAYQEDFAGARAGAESALSKKADYTPAILLLAQLSLNEGKLDDAIGAVNAAIVFNPRDSSLLYQLGLLQLQAKRYQPAADAFQAALGLTPDYANASFFLGQADVFLGKKDEALRIFKNLQTKNPDNMTLQGVITDLENGKNPFEQGTVPPAEQAPQSL